MARRTRSTPKGADAAGHRGGAKKGERRAGRSDRFEEINTATSKIVKQAAQLLDEELAAGMVAAKQMQDRFARERRVDPADFADALQRFQRDAHEVVTLLDEQFEDFRSDENAQVVSRLLTNAHDLVDVVVGVVNIGADVASQLAETRLGKPREPAPRSNRRG
jgi:hypothetical protein